LIGIKFNSESISSEGYDFFCQVCSTHVLEKSKHCSVCNRCVDIFDHHCNWMNNCIGKKNYRYCLHSSFRLFLFTLFWISLLCVYETIIAVISLAFVFTKDEYADRVADFYNINRTKSKALSGAIIILSSLSQLVTLIMALKLLLLHAWLKKHGLTTYDYTLYEREKENNPELNIEMQDARKMHKSKVIIEKNSIREELQRGALAEETSQRESNVVPENTVNALGYCKLLYLLAYIRMCCNNYYNKSAQIAPPVKNEEQQAIPDMIIPKNVN